MPRLNSIVPKLPMKDAAATKQFYQNLLGFTLLGDYGDYLLMKKDDVEIHFFLFPELVETENYGMCYIRTMGIESLYNDLKTRPIAIPTLVHLEKKSWGMMEFSITDPSVNLLTFGEPTNI